METVKDLLANALKRREELALESETLDKLIKLYRELDAHNEAQASNKLSGQMQLWDGSAPRRLQAQQVEELLEEARRLILKEQRPLKRGALVRMLEARGMHVIGSDKNKVFGTNVWRSNKFIQVPGEGYWPNDVPLPAEYAARGQGD